MEREWRKEENEEKQYELVLAGPVEVEEIKRFI
jgi:hypothetical protein